VTALFFIAANVYSRSFYEFLGKANMKTNLSLNQTELTLFSNCFEQPSLELMFASAIVLSGVSLNASNQVATKKNDPYDCRMCY